MKEPVTIKEPHYFPLPGPVADQLLSDIPGFCGITERNGKWWVDLSGPPALSVAREIVRRVRQ